jgi:hypothetical protein
VSRELCLPFVLTQEGLERVETITRLLGEAGIDVELDGATLLCFPENDHNPRRTRKDVLHVVSEAGMTGVLVVPKRALRWDDERHEFLEPYEPPQLEPPPATADQFRWAVGARPVDVFHERELRERIERLHRLVIGERDRVIECGAVDHDDATQLETTLAGWSIVRETTVRELGWFERWRIRERFLGNYVEGPGDPTMPP